MQRWTVLAFVGFLFAAGLWVVVGRGGAPAEPVPASAGSALAGSSGAPLVSPASSGGPIELAPPDDLLDLAAPSADAAAASPLPGDAPKQVGFGVVLVEYRGAQGAARDARTKADALSLSEALVAEAKKDFASAVKKGDKGSVENAGSMPRGMLEPGPELLLFGLAVGDVGGPVDTPRGFWIVKRLE